MAVYYVNSNATGTNTGTSWTNAWTSLASASAAAQADTVYIASNHNESAGGNLNIFLATGFKGGVRVLCVDSGTTGPLKTGAVVSTGGGGGYTLGLYGSWYCHGVTFEARLTLKWSNNTDTWSVFENCIFRSADATSGSYNIQPDHPVHRYHRLRFQTCSFYTTNTTAGRVWSWALNVNRDNKVEWIDCTFGPNTSSTSTTALFSGATTNYSCGWFRLIGCDVSEYGTLVDGLTTNTDHTFYLLFDRCRLKASATKVSGNIDGPGTCIDFVNCAEATISAPPLGMTHRQTHYGTLTSDPANYREGGASDGTTPVGWKVVTTTGTTDWYAWFESPPLTAWTTTTTTTVTVYIAGAADLNNDDIWIETISPNESTTAQGKWRTSKCGLLSTPTVIPRSSGTTWAGSGTGTDGGTGQQKMTATIAPAQEGPVTVRVFVSKPSTTVYIDPRIELS